MATKSDYKRPFSKLTLLILMRSKLRNPYIWILFILIFLLMLYAKYYQHVNVSIQVKPSKLKNLTNSYSAKDDLVVIYNRVPKTASTSFMGIVYELSSVKNFNVMHLNITKNIHIMTLADQYRFVENITNWSQRHPALVHGHFAFINFARFGQSNPVYINIIRKPLDRLVSYYYFLRNGDNFRPYLVRKKHGDKRTFDECFEDKANNRDCRVENLWLQIPFFCGQDADCWRPGNRRALEQAKRNLLEHFFLVGVTELLHEFIQLLEVSLPSIFEGSLNLFEKGNKSYLRQTYNKTFPSTKTISKIQQSRIWQMENEFYQFVLDQFNFIRNKSLNRINLPDGKIIWKDKGQQFFFEKIRPK